MRAAHARRHYDDFCLREHRRDSAGPSDRARAAEHPGKTGIYPLATGRDAFAARGLLAGAAERSLDVQYYIWHGDHTGYLLFEGAVAGGRARSARSRAAR
jgi:phosphatidylserine/phosphatidylglycerophosphate/cardiolipin synthase-like enzyme